MKTDVRQECHDRRKAIISLLFFVSALFLLVLLFLSASTVLGERTWYVDDDGGADFETIQEAVDAAEGGDTVRVREGTYQENVVLNRTLSLEGDGAENTTIIWGGEYAVVIQAPECHMSGFSVTGDPEIHSARRISVEASQVSLSDLYIHDSSGDGVYIIDSPGVTLRNVTVKRCEAYGFYVRNSSNCVFESVDSSSNQYGGLYVRDSSNCVFESVDSSSNYYGLYVRNSVSCTIRNSTFNMNRDDGISLELCNYSQVLNVQCIGNERWGMDLSRSNFSTVKDSLFSLSERSGLVVDRSYQSSIRNNMFYGNEESGVFVARDSHDFELYFNSFESNEVGVTNDDWSRELDATENWWGDASGPYHKTKNEEGKGDPVGEWVSFEPWFRRPGVLGECQWYVDADAPAGGDGSKEKPFRTIQKAVDAAEEGETLRVWEGTYREEIVLDKALYLIGNDSDTTTISWDGEYAVTIEASGCHMSGFSVTGDPETDDARRISVVAPQVTLSELYIHDCSGNGVYLIDSPGASLRNVTVKRCEESGIYLENSAGCSFEDVRSRSNYRGLWAWSSSSCLVRNSSFDMNQGYGVYLKDSPGWQLQDISSAGGFTGLVLSGSGNATIEDSELNLNKRSGLSMSNSDQNIIANNSFYDNAEQGIFVGLDSSDNEVHFNSFESNEFGIFVDADNPDQLNATQNWWGDVSGPYHKTENTEGTGDKVGHKVFFKPWLRSPGFPDKYHWYVDDNAPGGGVGSKEKPFRTVQEAVDAALDWDDIYVEEGNYQENVIIEKPLNLTGASPFTTVIDGGGEFAAVEILAPDVRLSGFGLTNAFWALDVTSSGSVIENNRCFKYEWGGIQIKNSSRITVHNNTCLGSGDHAGQRGIAILRSHRNIISSNHCQYNEDLGITIDGDENQVFDNNCSFNEDGINIENCRENIVFNNHCFMNEEIGISLDGHDNLLHNNSCLAGETGLVVQSNSTGNIVQDNLLASNAVGALFRKDSQDNSLHSNDILGNSEFGLSRQDDLGSPVVRAMDNWWGHETGPYHSEDNPSGKGDRVDDNVAFNPWEGKQDIPGDWLEVDDNAKGPGNGSSENPFPTIQAALEVAQTGSTIFVWRGYYEGPLVLDTTLSLIGEGRELVTIDGKGKGNTLEIQVDEFHLEGVLVTGCLAEKGYAGIYVYGDSVAIFNCSAKDNGNSGIKLDEDSSYSMIRQCRVLDNGDSGIGIGGEGHWVQDCLISGCSSSGLVLSQATSCTIENITITDNYRGFGPGIGGGVNVRDNSDRNKFIGCTIFHHNGHGFRFLDSSNNLIADSNITGCGQHGIYVHGSSSGNRVEESVISGNQGNGILMNGVGRMEALHNYWGHNSGPHHPELNPEGQGDQVSDNVDFDPWTVKEDPDERKTWYVYSSGPQSGDGSKALPFRKITTALNNAKDGDTIKVMVGVYNESVLVDKRVTITGSGPGRSVISVRIYEDLYDPDALLFNTNQAYVGMWVTAPGVHINNLSFTSRERNKDLVAIETGAIGLLVEADDVIISDVNSSEMSYGIYLLDSSGTVVENCNISGNRWGWGLGTAAMGIHLQNAHYTVLENCRLSENREYGIFVRTSNHVSIRNCVISGNEKGVLIWAEDLGDSTDIVLHYNIIAGNEIMGLDASWNGSSLVNATLNYWGSNTGPNSTEHNPNGTGDRLSGNVSFIPWLNEDGNVNQDAQPPSSSENDYLNISLRLGAVGLLFLLFFITLAASEVLRFQFLKLLLPLYTRLSGQDIEEDIREQSIRGRIYQYIEDNPGISFSAVRDKVSAGNGTTVYHLSVLEREGYVRAASQGNHKLFWVRREFPGARLATVTPIQRELLDLLERKGELTRKKLLGATGVSKSTLHVNIKQLVKQNMVKERKVGRESYCSLK